MKSLKNRKLVFFHDWLSPHDEELDNLVLGLQALGYNVDRGDIKRFNSPPPVDENFDILFFDYGGVGFESAVITSDWLWSMADLYPNRDFVMVSDFTREAISDIEKRYYKLPNIFYDIDTWYAYFEERG